MQKYWNISADPILFARAMLLVQYSTVSFFFSYFFFDFYSHNFPLISILFFKTNLVGGGGGKDVVLDVAELERYIEELPMRGVKGTTGTQATFLQLFDGDHEKVPPPPPPPPPTLPPTRTLD